MNNYKIKLINIFEFDKLSRLFSGTEEEWLKYRYIKLNELSHNDINIFVIDYKGIFIGELTVNYISHTLTKETIPNIRLYFDSFAVDKNFQDLGLGQKLLSYVLNYYQNKGYIEFTIGVKDDNLKAKYLYHKFGFETIEELFCHY